MQLSARSSPSKFYEMQLSATFNSRAPASLGDLPCQVCLVCRASQECQ